MKLILEAQSAIRIRLTQSEFLKLESEKILVNSFPVLGNASFQIKILSSFPMEREQVRFNISESTNIYEICLSPQDVEILKRPSKNGIESTVETKRGIIHLGVEVDLKRH